LELALAGGFAAEIEETKLNNYFKGLIIIEASKQGMIPQILHEELDRKMSFYSYTSEEQNRMNVMMLKIITNANENNTLCRNKEGKMKPLTFKKMVNLVADELVQRM
jgi:hypothetical protein